MKRLSLILLAVMAVLILSGCQRFASAPNVDKRNLRNLIDMSRQRMCTRAYWEFRELFADISTALMNRSAEWEEVVARCFHAKCEETGRCPEKHSCRKYPPKYRGRESE